MSGQNVLDRIKSVGESVQEGFVANRRVLTFVEYLALMEKAPLSQLRGAAQYLRDAFDYYGSEDIRYPTGKIRRFKLFDAPWDDGVGRLIGQEEVQNSIYRILSNFARQGRADRFILLHGPNGSSKSTISELLARALEHYSTVDDGALYRFNWVFPTQAIERSGIGFGGKEGPRVGPGDSYAHLDDTAIDARIPCELRDHPILLIPQPMRRELIDRVLGEHDGTAGFTLADYIGSGDLCHKCKLIYEALLGAYEGDFMRVLRHVQVERFYISRRYRVGATRVDPRMAVDASSRQITVDRSLASLPSAMQTVSLYEVDGELVGGNRGIVDFADLFKRPLEAFKYLLTTVESGHVGLAQANLFLDLIFVGSANELHFNAFMESPEWTSFKARMELVRVPYLRNYRLECEIYDDQLDLAQLGKPVAPHVTEIAALWAVLTRLRRPNAGDLDEALRTLISKLTPSEKAVLYAEGKVPSGASDEAAKLLRANTAALYRETSSTVNYEGRTGASAREVKTALMNAAQDFRFDSLGAEAVLGQLSELVQEKSVYEFLRQEVQGQGYYDHEGFVEVVRQWYLDRVDDEVRAAMGLVEESSYADLFGRYVTHVTHALRKEKLLNPVTGALEDSDERLMAEVEKSLGIENQVETFRQGIMSRIGAWSIDNPGEKPDFSVIFGEHFARIRKEYFGRQHKRVSKALHHALRLIAGDTAGLAEHEVADARRMLGRLKSEHGYAERCAREALVMLARNRYVD